MFRPAPTKDNPNLNNKKYSFSDQDQNNQHDEQTPIFDLIKQGKKLSFYQIVVLFLTGLVFIFVGVVLFRTAFIAQKQGHSIEHTISRYDENRDFRSSTNDISLVDRETVEVDPIAQYGWSFLFIFSGLMIISFLSMNVFILALLQTVG